MALKSKQTENKQNYEVKVLRAKDFSKEGAVSIAIDLEVNGVTIYGAYYREGKKKDGSDYQMLAFPSKKGNDGKYYNHVFFKASDELVENIAGQIDSLLG